MSTAIFGATVFIMAIAATEEQRFAIPRATTSGALTELMIFNVDFANRTDTIPESIL